MTNEELKKKISEIALTELQVQFGCGDTVEVGDREACAESIADALIAAGIGDVKESENKATAAELVAQAAASTAIEKIEEWKHRAEVAERAFFNFALYCAKTVSPDYVRNTSEENQIEYAKDICKEWREQAEKELAEERKDEN